MVLYVLILIPSAWLLPSHRDRKVASLVGLSAAGIAFSGFLTAIILSAGPSCIALTTYGIPSCLLGLMMYALVFVLAVSLVGKPSSPQT